MVMYVNYEGTRFNRNLLSYIKESRNEEVRRILENFQTMITHLNVYQMTDSSHATLLHYAAQWGNVDIVKELIDRKSDVNSQDKFGRTPLMLALVKQHEVVAQTFLKANASIHLTDVMGKSALQMIFQLEQKLCLRIIKTMFGYLSLDTIIQGTSPDDLVKNLKRVGFRLRHTVSMEHIELVEVLLKNGYSANEVNPANNDTVLHIAVKKKNLEIVKLLVENGANVEALDSTKALPLWYLYRNENVNTSKSLEILSILMSRVTLLNNHVNCKKRMQIYGILIHGCKQAVLLILNCIDNVHLTDEIGNTVIHYMAKNKNEGVIELLRGHSYDVNRRNKDTYTPLHCAAFEALPNNVQFLLENEANVDARGFSNDTPLNCVFQQLKFHDKYGDVKKCIQLLLKHGADAFDYDVIQQFDRIYKYRLRLENSNDILNVMKPILLHLAASKVIRIEICEFIQKKIELQREWIDYFNLSQSYAKKVSETVMFGSITVRDFLTCELKKISAYVRNENLISNFKIMIDEWDSTLPYPTLLKKRLSRAICLAELEKNAVSSVFRIINLKNRTPAYVAEYIVDYLSDEDMKNLHCAWCK